MAEPHEANVVPNQVDGFTTALRLLTRRSESTADTMGFKYSKPELPKMDLNGGVGTKRVPEAQPLFDMPHNVTLGEAKSSSKSSGAHSNHSEAPTMPTIPRPHSQSMPQTPSLQPARDSCIVDTKLKPETQGHRPALSPSQATALKLVPDSRFDVLNERLSHATSSALAQVPQQISIPSHFPISPPRPLLKPAENTSTSTGPLLPGKATTSTGHRVAAAPEVSYASCSAPVVDTDMCISACVEDQAQDYQAYNQIVREASGSPVGVTTDSCSSGSCTTLPNGASQAQSPTFSQAHGRAKSSDRLQVPEVLSPRPVTDRVKKSTPSLQRTKPALHTSTTKSSYQTSDIVKLLAKKLEEEQQEVAAAADLAFQEQEKEIDRLHQVLKDRDLCLASTENKLALLQEDAALKADAVRKMQEKAAKFSKFMTGIGSEMTILKSDHKDLKREHARLQLYSKHLEIRSKKLQTETGNYQAAFRKYRTQTQEEMTEAGGQLKLLSLRHNDLEQQRDQSAALLAEERDRSTHLAQQLSKANEQFEGLHVRLRRDRESIHDELELLLASLEKSRSCQEPCPELDRILNMIGTILKDKEQSAHELQSIKSVIDSAANNLSGQLYHLQESQSKQAGHVSKQSVVFEHGFASVTTSFLEQQRSQASLHDLMIANSTLETQLRSSEVISAERTQQRDALRASEIRLQERILNLQAELQTMKERHARDAHLSRQIEHSENECAGLRAKLSNTEEQLSEAQQSCRTANGSIESLQARLSSLNEMLEVKEELCRVLADSNASFAHNAQENMTEARRQWLQDSQKADAEKQLQIEIASTKSARDLDQLQRKLQEHVTELSSLKIERDELKEYLASHKSSFQQLQEQLQAQNLSTEKLNGTLGATELAKHEVECRLSQVIEQTKIAGQEKVVQLQADLLGVRVKLQNSELALAQGNEKIEACQRKYSEDLAASQVVHQEELNKLSEEVVIAKASLRDRDESFDAARAEIHNVTIRLKDNEKLRMTLSYQVDAQANEIAGLKSQIEHTSFASRNVLTRGTQTKGTLATATNEPSDLAETTSRKMRKIVNRHDGSITLVDASGVDLSAVQASGPGNTLAIQQEALSCNTDSQGWQSGVTTSQAVSDVFGGLDVVNPDMLSMMGYSGQQTSSQRNEDNKPTKHNGSSSPDLPPSNPIKPSNMPDEESSAASSSSLSDLSPQTLKVLDNSQPLRDLSTNSLAHSSMKKAGSLKRPATTKMADAKLSTESRHLEDWQPSGATQAEVSQASNAKDIDLSLDIEGFSIPKSSRKPKYKCLNSDDNEDQGNEMNEQQQPGLLVRAKPMKSSLKRQSTTESSTVTPRKVKKPKQVAHADSAIVHHPRPLSNGSQGSSQHSVTETRSISITTSSRVRSFTSPNARQPPVRSTNQRRVNVTPGPVGARKATRASAPFSR